MTTSKDEEKDAMAATTDESARARGEAVAQIAARELLGERGVLRIDLDGEIYTLRLTRNNRLILTK